MNFNPRSPSGLRLFFLRDVRGGLGISIHAARVGCDVLCYYKVKEDDNDFNPRSPSGLRRGKSI